VIPYFIKADSTEIQLGHDGYGIWRGSSNANITIYPRTIGGIIKPSYAIEKNLTLNAYMIPPSDTTRTRVEYFFHQLNEEIGAAEGSIRISGNTYEHVYTSGINPDFYITKDFIRYTIDFIVGNQDTNGEYAQKSVPDLYDLGRGRKLKFTTKMLDETERTFEFWHNVDNVRALEVDVAVQESGKDGKTGKIIRAGGFERISCQCWFTTFAENTRQTIEAYLFNMINGPLGQIGTFVVDAPGENTYNNCFLEGVSMGEELFRGARYELTFLTPLQC